MIQLPCLVHQSTNRLKTVIYQQLNGDILIYVDRNTSYLTWRMSPRVAGDGQGCRVTSTVSHLDTAVSEADVASEENSGTEYVLQKMSRYWPGTYLLLLLKSRDITANNSKRNATEI